jgi:hypothetical protein
MLLWLRRSCKLRKDRRVAEVLFLAAMNYDVAAIAVSKHHSHIHGSGDVGVMLLRNLAVQTLAQNKAKRMNLYGAIFSHTRMLRPSRPSVKFLAGVDVMVSVFPSSV